MADAIDRLVDRFNRIDGLTFYRDARMKNEPKVNYGIVRLTGESDAQWADGHMIDQAFGLAVAIYVKDEDAGWLAEVQAALDEFDLFYRLPARNYLYDKDTVEWEWTATLYGPLEVDDNGADDL